jgi:hypothetical protein
MEIDKLIKSADIVRLLRHKESNGWVMFKEWTKPDQLGSYWIGNLWELDQ